MAIDSAEALIRWAHPKEGDLSPAAFLEIAENSSLIHELTDFVVNDACAKAAEWRSLAIQAGETPWYVAVNISGHNLEQIDLVKKISDALKRYQLPADLLHAEVTESVLLFPGAAFQLRKLRQRGVKISIDDFGTGYSSLSYLNRFTVDTLKIDRSLTSELDAGSYGQKLAKCIVYIAHQFGLETISEGVETEEQLKKGQKIGFDLVQGYYFSRPLDAADIPDTMLSPAGHSHLPDSFRNNRRPHDKQ